MNFIEIINYYIRSELIVEVPALFLLEILLKKSKVKSEKIPMILLGVSLFITSVYTFSVCTISDIHGLCSCIFSIITQGIILCGAGCFLREFSGCFSCMMKKGNKPLQAVVKQLEESIDDNHNQAGRG